MQTHTCPCGTGPGVPRQGFLPFQTQAKQQELLLLSGWGGSTRRSPPGGTKACVLPATSY